MSALPARIAGLLALVVVAWSLSACSVVGGIFKAGVWVGVVAVVLVLALIIWAISRVTR